MQDRSVVPKRRPMIVRQLSDELLVYDRKSKKAYCLNKVAGEVWELCDGKRTIGQMIEHFKSKKGSVIDKNVVRLTLHKLQKSGLLETDVQSTDRVARPSRRSLIKKLGIAAAVAVPVVTSILVPTIEAAGSPCRAALKPCPHGNSQCCSGVCLAGVCA